MKRCWNWYKEKNEKKHPHEGRTEFRVEKEWKMVYCGCSGLKYVPLNSFYWRFHLFLPSIWGIWMKKGNLFQVIWIFPFTAANFTHTGIQFRYIQSLQGGVRVAGGVTRGCRSKRNVMQRKRHPINDSSTQLAVLGFPSFSRSSILKSIENWNKKKIPPFIFTKRELFHSTPGVLAEILIQPEHYLILWRSEWIFENENLCMGYSKSVIQFPSLRFFMLD